MAQIPEQHARAVIYCRVSSVEQVKGTSLEMQERQCREYTERILEASVAQVFVEMGESAKTTNRFEFQKALQYATDRSNKVNYFVVWKVDRFARSQEGHVTTSAFLKKFGVKLRSVSEPIDDTILGHAMEGILSVFAELDNDIRAQRSRNGMAERVRQGYWVWPAPIGYKRLVKGGNLVIDEEKAPYIQMAFSEWSKGEYSYQTLADFLNKEGFRTNSGKRMYAQQVEKIIRNPVYAGLIRSFDMEVKAAFPPIVEEEIFVRCQPGVRRSRKITTRIWNNPDFPLRRFAKCALCGKNLTGSFSTGRGGVRYPLYHHQKQGCELARSISKDDFENRFMDLLQKVTPKHEQYEKVFKAIVMDVWQSNYRRLDADNAKLRKEIEVLERERQQVFDLHRTGIYSDTDFVEQKDRVILFLQKKKLLFEEKRIEEFSMEEALNFCFDMVRDGSMTWAELKTEPVLRGRFQKMIFPQKVSFDGKKFDTDKMTIVYQLNQSAGTDSSKLVRRVGFEPT